MVGLSQQEGGEGVTPSGVSPGEKCSHLGHSRGALGNAVLWLLWAPWAGVGADTVLLGRGLGASEGPLARTPARPGRVHTGVASRSGRACFSVDPRRSGVDPVSLASAPGAA